jgi:hypothetical protein
MGDPTYTYEEAVACIELTSDMDDLYTMWKTIKEDYKLYSFDELESLIYVYETRLDFFIAIVVCEHCGTRNLSGNKVCIMCLTKFVH